MNKTMGQYFSGALLGLMAFLSGIVETYETMYFGKNSPALIALFVRIVVTLGIIAAFYAILLMTWKLKSTTSSESQSRAATLLAAIIFWLSLPVIGTVPKTIASLFPGFTAYTSGGIYGYVLVLGTLMISGIILSQIIFRLFSSSFSDNKNSKNHE